MTASQILQLAGEAFERGRRMGASEGDAMDLALREMASLRQQQRSGGARGRSVPLSEGARAVIDNVLASHGLTLADARKRGRIGGGRMQRARDEAVHMARLADRDASYAALGAHFERDHASLVAGERRFEKRLATDQVFAARIRRVVEYAEAARAAREAQVAGGSAC